MYLPEFAYFEPETIQEACSLMSKGGGKAKLLAGGTDLLVRMKRGLEKPESLVSFNRITAFRDIRVVGDSLSIGALTTINQLVDSPNINEKAGILGQAVKMMALPQVRNRGTIGGNLCNASPAADTVPALMALNSQVRVVGLNGEWTIPLEIFFLGPGQTVLQNGEILTEIIVPIPSRYTGGSYQKLSPRHNDLATASAAAVLVMSSDGRTCEDARIVLGAVAPTAIRCHQAEQVLRGRTIDEETIREAARMAAEICQPISDIRASSGYRRDMMPALVKRAIDQAMEQSRQLSSGGETL
jgi:aerobic carbon-monoxide dehydrogenase medium subunit